MVEPPGDLGRTGILEVDDCVFVAIELALVEKRARAVQKTSELKVHIVADTLAIKPREQSRRGCTVEAFVVIENANFQSNSFPVISGPTSDHAADIAQAKSV